MGGHLMDKNGMLCCFCNENITSSNLNPCDLNISTNWDKPKNTQHNQTFWCHLECFHEKLHRNVQQHLVVHLLTNED